MTSLKNRIKYINTPLVIGKHLNTWESLMPAMLEDEQYDDISISDSLSYAKSYDFRGLLLKEFNIPPHLIYPNMRLNNMISGDQFEANMTELKIFKSEYLERIYDTYVDI